MKCPIQHHILKKTEPLFQTATSYKQLTQNHSLQLHQSASNSFLNLFTSFKLYERHVWYKLHIEHAIILHISFPLFPFNSLILFSYAEHIMYLLKIKDLFWAVPFQRDCSMLFPCSNAEVEVGASSAITF